MDCRTTSTRRSPAGVTLVELLVSIALGAIVLTGLAQVLFYSGRSFAAISNYSDLDYNSDYTLKVMSR